jgi:hypothetical protein
MPLVDKPISLLPRVSTLPLTDLLAKCKNPDSTPGTEAISIADLITALGGTTAASFCFGNDPRLNAITPSGLENYEASYNPFNAPYNAVGDGADDYLKIFQCISDAISKFNATVYIPFPMLVSQTLLIPVAGFKLPYIMSVNLTTNLITMSLDPGGSTGDPTQFQGATPAGMNRGTQYYRNFPNPANRTQIFLYDTREHALAGGATGLIDITADVNTTGTITGGSVIGTNNKLTVAAELHDKIGTNIVISDGSISGATGGFYIMDGIGTGTLSLTTTAKSSGTGVKVTYVCYLDSHSFDGGLKITYAPGAYIGKHHTFTTVAGSAVLKGATGSDIQILGGGTQGLSSQFVPLGVTASVSGTKFITITGDISWALPGVAFTLGGGAVTYYVDTVAGQVISAMLTSVGAPSWPTLSNVQVGQGLSSGIVGITATASSGSTVIQLNSVDGMFNGLSVYFASDTLGGHAISAVSPSLKQITVSPAINTNLSNAAVVTIGGDDGIDISSVRHAIISFHKFRHCGDAALRMQSNVAYYGSKSASDPFGGVNTSQITITNCNFYNVYQTSTTTNNYTQGGARDIYFVYNKFEFLRGSVKFAGRVPGSRNINIIHNIITSSDNHGLECDSQSGLRILYNEINNVANQGIYILSNNGPTLTHLVAGTNTTILAATTAGSGTVTVTSSAAFGIGGTGNIFGVTGPFTVTGIVDATHITVSPVCDATVSVAPISLSGLSIVGFPYDGLTITGNTLDNCGQNPGTSSIKMTPDLYKDGFLFDYKGVTINNNIIQNVSSTTHVGIYLQNGSYVGLRMIGNNFINFNGITGIKATLRGAVAFNGIRIDGNDIAMNNASGYGIWLEQTSGAFQINGSMLDSNMISGTCNRCYVLGSLNNTKISNPSDIKLVTGGFLLFNQSGTGNGVMNNFTVDGRYYLTRTTTTATATSLLLDGSTATAKVVIDDNECISFSAQIAGRDIATGNAGFYKIEGLVKRGTGAASVALVGTPVVTTIAEDIPAWNVSVVADTMNGGIDFQVTGAAATTIHWSARVTAVEIT